MTNRFPRAVRMLLPVAAAFVAFSCIRGDRKDTGLDKINHIVVIYLENHSFDNLFGEFPGADGIANVKYPQVDSTGTPYVTLTRPAGDTVLPEHLPNAPFNIDQFLPIDKPSPNPTHKFYQEQMQINGGRMDKFALVSSARGFVMGYYRTAGLRLANEAKNYVLCDNFFHSAFGGSFLNHIWLIAAATPQFPGADSSYITWLDAQGNIVNDDRGFVTKDGYVINTCYSVYTPHPAGADPNKLLPKQTMKTIGDELIAANVSWAWYAGGWDSAMAGHPDPSFQFHHQPFVYFESFADGTRAKQDHLKDETEFLRAAKAGTLPSVSFVKPIGNENEHPGYANVAEGEQHVQRLIDAVRNGPNWNDALIIVTYDEHGGFWDHVAPPKIDKWGPGTRVPAVLISPFVKQGFVDHTQYETVSILSLIQHRYHLQSLGFRDGQALYFQAALK